MLREEIRIKDARIARIPPARRPHYAPIDRLAILELRAARGWSLAQTARVFLLADVTIASWTRRLDEEGEHALVKTPTPVNTYPDFVRHIVERLKLIAPAMGRRRIADTLARAGLHLGATTVNRWLDNPGGPVPVPPPSAKTGLVLAVTNALDEVPFQSSAAAV